MFLLWSLLCWPELIIISGGHYNWKTISLSLKNYIINMLRTTIRKWRHSVFGKWRHTQFCLKNQLLLFKSVFLRETKRAELLQNYDPEKNKIFFEKKQTFLFFSSILPQRQQMVSRSCFPRRVVGVVVEVAASTLPRQPRSKVNFSWGRSSDPNPERCCSVEDGAEAWPLVFVAFPPRYSQPPTHVFTTTTRIVLEVRTEYKLQFECTSINDS